jgi:ABC-type sugar transport system substrate-binding protein
MARHSDLDAVVIVDNNMDIVVVTGLSLQVRNVGGSDSSDRIVDAVKRGLEAAGLTLVEEP